MPRIYKRTPLKTMQSRPIRVIIVGNTQIGKTTLIERIVTGEFAEETKPTLSPTSQKHIAEIAGGHEVDLRLWDTAGQERFQAISNMFYRDSDIGLVCFDCSNPACYTSIPVWRSAILEHEPKCRLTLVGTKLDLVDEARQGAVMAEANELAVKYGFGTGNVICTSSKTGQNVEDLITKVATMAYNEILLGNTAKVEKGKETILSIQKDQQTRETCC